MSALWVPAGQPRLALYAVGRYYDGWLARAGAIYLWPAEKRKPLTGQLSLTLTAPPRPGAVALRFLLPRGEQRLVRVRPGAPTRVSIAVCAARSWYTVFRASSHGLVGSRVVSVRATAPVFTPAEDACPPSAARLPARPAAAA